MGDSDIWFAPVGEFAGLFLGLARGIAQRLAALVIGGRGPIGEFVDGVGALAAAAVSPGTAKPDIARPDIARPETAKITATPPALSKFIIVLTLTLPFNRRS